MFHLHIMFAVITGILAVSNLVALAFIRTPVSFILNGLAAVFCAIASFLNIMAIGVS